jgi:hypothetical protein
MRLHFTNYNPQHAILAIWHSHNDKDYAASWLNDHKAEITYSLEPFQKVTISVANHYLQSGFSAIYPDTHVQGQIYNTWGEFSTNGRDSVINVSREPWMKGQMVSAKPRNSQCIADMTHCSFVCKSGDRCGEAGTYNLINCDPALGAINSQYPKPEGGCRMGDGGDIDIILGV